MEKGLEYRPNISSSLYGFRQGNLVVDFELLQPSYPKVKTVLNKKMMKFVRV